VQFKDFDKDVKDLLTKQYGTAWKIESKFKGPKDTVFINPQADSKGVNVDVEYECANTGAKIKTNVNSNLAIKPKVTYENGAHKVEASTTGDVRDLDYELNYELKEKGFAAGLKLTKKAVDASAVVSVAHHCVVGGGVTYDLSGKAPLGYTLGARYNAKGTILNLSTAALKSFSIGALKGLTIAGQDATVASQVTYSSTKTDVVVGLEIPCLLSPETSTWKLRVNSQLNVAVALIRKFGDSWKAALSYEYVQKNNNALQFGLQLIREPK